MTTQQTVIVEENTWPLVVFRFLGEMTLDDVDVYNGALDTALARDQRFGVIMAATPAYLESGRSNEVANKSMKWLKQNKPLLAAKCAGIATVIGDNVRREAYAQIADQQGEKIYGCPLRTFATIDEARAWLATQLAVYSDLQIN